MKYFELVCKAVRDIGFPIVVSLILLLKLIPAVNELTAKVDKVCTVLEVRK
jgi:hypothetical protein